MYIWKATKKRGPIDPKNTPYIDEEGTKYAFTPMELLEEIDDPTPPKEFNQRPDLWYREDRDDAPYTVWRKYPDSVVDQIESAAINSVTAQFKTYREVILNRLTGTMLELQLVGETGSVVKFYVDVRKKLKTMFDDLPADSVQARELVYSRYSKVKELCAGQPQFSSVFNNLSVV